ncbi:glyoxysomal processing protease, glyoxysomal-like isoform X1 [Phragmites australis]|uniref:glyoxysomal processing protease, glyoxysomal-like isoform X1 n=1 Tax=Phragmites australis TaxID=29695 RepID=UPI002D79B815|nr:glyoxysomal processing protease, glyoxysomal-like isoform X1 [Phragmites australis]
MRRHAFHLQQSGSTSLSASAVLLPRDSLADPPPLLDRICAAHGHVAGDVALTAASLVESFLVAEQRDRPDQELHPRLVPEARLDVLVEQLEIPQVWSNWTNTMKCSRQFGLWTHHHAHSSAAFLRRAKRKKIWSSQSFLMISKKF